MSFDNLSSRKGRLYVERNLRRDAVELFLCISGRGADGTYQNLVAKPIDLIEGGDELTPLDPFVSFSQEQAQTLYDALHASGFRTSTQIDEASRVTAVSAHLEDMRRLLSFTINQGVASEDNPLVLS